ncbi:MAG: NAD(P)-dependent oxidoreductase, partial [Egibacteraceae bacterium]
MQQAQLAQTARLGSPEAPLGFVGLGVMGQPMVRNLLRAGFELRLYGRKPDVVRALVDEGATACSSIREVAEGAGAVLTMLPDAPDVEAVTLGDDGLAAGLAPGSVLVDMST